MGIAILLRLDETSPDLLVLRSGPVNRAIPPFGKTPASRSGGFRRKTVTLVPSRRFAFVEPLPRSHSARCSSSKTMVLPRGLTWANPFDRTVATRHTWAGKAVLMCS